MSAIRLAVDCMGGDHGPSATLPACQAFLAAHPEAELILVGRAEALAPAAGWARCQIVAATEVVEMDDAIEIALRRKKDSSLRVAVSQVKPGADGAPRYGHFAAFCETRRPRFPLVFYGHGNEAQLNRDLHPRDEYFLNDG